MNDHISDENRVIKGLWIGEHLSPNEVLSIKSYLYHGHDFHLYTYDRVKNVPEGTVLKSAEQIISVTDMLGITNMVKKNKYTVFSNIFRYKLLFEQGGWWSDLDAICNQPYDINKEYVFVEEKIKYKADKVCNGILKAPAGSEIMYACYRWAYDNVENINQMHWFSLGPALMDKMVRQFNLTRYVFPSCQFIPIGSYQVEQWLKPYNIHSDVYSIHLYNDMWNGRHISKYGIYSGSSLLSTLKKRYGVKNNYLKLAPEFINDFRAHGLKKGFMIVKDKIWFMYRSFR